MAILRGFPPSNTISPSVRIVEKDLSLVLPAPSFHRAGLVGFASKGPVNLPTLIRSRRELHRTFGFPHPQESDPYLIYAAEQYLFVATELFVVRVADESSVSDEQATVASIDVPTSGALIEIESDEDGPYTFSEDKFFRWRLNGVLSSTTLVVLADTYTTDELVDALNDQLTPSIHGIEFYATTDDEIAVKTVFSYGPASELELVSVQDSMYGGAVVDGNVAGLGLSMTRAVITGTKTKYPDNSYQIAGLFDFVGLTDLNLQVVVEGTDNTAVDDIVQIIDLEDLEGLDNSLTTIISEINSQALGFEAYTPGGNLLALRTLAYGRDSKLLVKASSTADAIFGLSNVTAEGTSPTRVSGDADVEVAGRVTGEANSASTVSFTIQADSSGIEGNNTQVVISTDSRTGTWNFQVFSNGAEVEQWGNLTKDTTSRFYIETYLALVSDFVRCVDNTATTEGPLDGTYALTGGTDGIPSDPDEQDGLLIGNDVAMTGMQALSDPEQVDIDLVAVPGHPSTDVIVALLNLCQDRQDCFSIIDPPFGLTVNEIVDWQNGTHPYNLTRFDSDFGALYWPWVRLRDTTNRVDVWVPPSGSVLATYARSDTLSAPWFAPAGLTRGIVPNITNVFSRPSLEERDLMYGNRNAVNPIVQFQDISDFVIFGQKTLQRLPTALDRVNVRRMMLVAEKRIRTGSRTLLFEPHDAALRAEFVRLATNVLEEIKGQRGINDFLVQCDEELNPPDVIDRNELRARIGIQPLRAVEFIFIEFSIHRTGSFTENADTF